MRTLEAEARGDWSNLRGAEYHLVYALWALLCGHAEEVSFYEGNDLRARAIAPPRLSGEPANLPPVPLLESRPHADEWVQLKATEKQWTCAKLLGEDTLLSTFIHNALLSRGRERACRVRLVTQAPVEQSDVLKFVSDPDRTEFKRKKERLVAIGQGVREALVRENQGGSVPDVDALCRIGLDLLRQLAETQPLHLATMRAEVERELALAYPDRMALSQMAQRLLGRLLSDGAAGPNRPQIYDRAWLDGTLGRPTRPRGLLHSDPAAACDAQVAAAVPLRWDTSRYVPRDALHVALAEFLRSDATVFVLTGENGTGKSWALAHWASTTRAGTIRLLVPGSSLDRQHTLPAVAAEAVRRYTDNTANWRDEQLLAALEAAATVDEHGPLTLIVDGLVPIGEAGTYRRDIGRLAEMCSQRRIKLILSCQLHLWEVYHLGLALDPAVVYAPTANARSIAIQSTSDPRARFDLPDFSPPQQAVFASRSLPAEVAEQTILTLRSPGLVFLRNPYLLSVYIDLIPPGPALMPSLDSDNLIDRHLDNRLGRIAEALTTHPETVRQAFAGLVADLWASRAGHYTPGRARQCLEEYLPANALQAFRDEGLLSISGDVRIGDSVLSDRIFAKHLAPALTAGTLDVRLLQPRQDRDVVSALTRDIAMEPVRFVEQLLAEDREWLAATVAGLARRRRWTSGDEVAALAFLTCVARPTERKHRINHEACFALGRLAAQRRGRDRRAYVWLASLFMSEYEVERSCAYFGVSELLDVNPRAAEALMRLRMARAATVADSSLPEQRSAWLARALAPLRHTTHTAAAMVGQRLLHRYASTIAQERQRAERGDTDAAIGFLEDVDSARGPIAFYSGPDSSLTAVDPSEIRRILAELAADEAATRLDAARALRLVLYHLEELRIAHAHQPDPSTQGALDGTGEILRDCFEAVCHAISSEQDQRVLEQVLSGAYHFGNVDADTLLDALSEGGATRWDQPTAACGQCLILLGNLASLRPERVYRLLPERLAAYPGWYRAYHAELLAYTWWRCAEHYPPARVVLAKLSEPDLDGVEEAARPFALRGAAIAQMSILCLGHVSASELLQRRAFYSLWQPLFLHMYTDEFAEQHAGYLIEQEGWGRLRALLLQSVMEEQRVQVPPIQPDLHSDQYRCAKLSLEILVRAACAGDDVETLLDALPRDWPVLHAAWRALEGGRTEQPVVQLVHRLAVEEAVGSSIQAASERTDCLRVLRRLVDDPSQVTAELEKDMQSRFSGGVERARTLADLAGADSSRTIALLEWEWRDERAVEVIYRWGRECERWQHLLIARIFTRMLDERAIQQDAAEELCRAMCTALEGLPPSPEARAWLALYQGLITWLQGGQPILTQDSRPTNLLIEAHNWAVTLLERARTEKSICTDAWVLARARDRLHWFDVERFGPIDQRVRSVAYFVPAMRLALCALGAREGLVDPAGQLMREKRACDQALAADNGIWSPWNTRIETSMLEAALDVRMSLLAQVQWYDRLWWEYGDILLRLRRIEQAKIALRRAARLARGNIPIRASAHYDLACIFALQRRSSRCRVLLTLALRRSHYSRQLVERDPDLAAIRDEQWFVDLLDATTQ